MPRAEGESSAAKGQRSRHGEQDLLASSVPHEFSPQQWLHEENVSSFGLAADAKVYWWETRHCRHLTAHLQHALRAPAQRVRVGAGGWRTAGGGEANDAVQPAQTIGGTPQNHGCGRCVQPLGHLMQLYVMYSRLRSECESELAAILWYWRANFAFCYMDEIDKR